MTEILSPLHGQLLQWCVHIGQDVQATELLAVMEAMKMEHEVRAPVSGRVTELLAAVGDTLPEGVCLAMLKPETGQVASQEMAVAGPPANEQDAALTGDNPRADLQRLQARLTWTEDAQRPQAMAKRHALGLRSARENLADLCDPGSLQEYGAMAVAAQSGRRSMDDLVAQTPADGLITGIARVNSELFDVRRASVAVMAYDPTVLAGTQGKWGHQKADRILGVAYMQKLPLVLLAEGGGGRPGDDDMPVVTGMHMTTFSNFARLNGRVPVVGLTAGRCFAGNAALLGCCDVIIATRDSSIGMGGPAMVEGGGMGRFRPEEIGPASVQHANGVIDILVDDEAQAVSCARRYLAFFQGALTNWTRPDTHALRNVVPENRLRVYDSRLALNGIADPESLLELRTGFGRSIHTVLGRIEGRAVGFLASNPQHLGGAIDADAADKAARFMQLCSNFGVPLVGLVDTPGFMVGPAVEEKAQVRHSSRMFIAAAHLRVPYFSVVLRKGYGLGAMAMTAGGFHSPMSTVSWPTGEFGGMGIEGFVRLGYRKELEAQPEGPQRDALFQRLVRERYASGGAIPMAQTLELDAVIDPADTRSWLAAMLAAAPQVDGHGMHAVDSW